MKKIEWLDKQKIINKWFFHKVKIFISSALMLNIGACEKTDNALPRNEEWRLLNIFYPKSPVKINTKTISNAFLTWISFNNDLSHYHYNYSETWTEQDGGVNWDRDMVITLDPNNYTFKYYWDSTEMEIFEWFTVSWEKEELKHIQEVIEFNDTNK